jgi:hypothetical protein
MSGEPTREELDEIFRQLSHRTIAHRYVAKAGGIDVKTLVLQERNFMEREKQLEEEQKKETQKFQRVERVVKFAAFLLFFSLLFSGPKYLFWFLCISSFFFLFQNQ